MKKKGLIAVAALLVITAAVTIAYLCTRTKTAEGDILVRYASSESTIHFNDLPLTDVSGETTNKKGETKTIEGKGYPLLSVPDLVNADGYSKISVYADDEYHADLTSEELAANDNAFLIKDEKGIRFVVFGGPADLAVKNVVRIEIE